MQPESPVFSVVIPCYNASRFIGSALASLGAQTFKGFDVVIVDDGSTDDSLAVIDAHRGPLVMKVLSQQNSGVAAARNTGVRNSDGTYVAFLDADDVWDPTKLERVYEVITRSAPDLVCHDERFIRDGRVIRVVSHGPHTSYEDLLLKGNSLSTSAVCIRRDAILRAGGFCEDLDIGGVEDYDLWMRLARGGARFYYLHEVLGSYRLHDQNLTSSHQYDRHEFNLIERHLRTIDTTSPGARRRASRRWAAHFGSIAFRALDRGETVASVRAYARMFRCRPALDVAAKYSLAGPVWIAYQRIRRSFGGRS